MTPEEIKALVKSEIHCGDCRGLTKDALLPSADKACGVQGMQEDSNICKHFRTDSGGLRDLMQKNGDTLVGLFELFATLEDRDLRLIAGMLLSESKTRRQGVKMGQPVFVRYRGRESRNYLNNFMSARILDIDEKSVRLISEDGQMVLTYPNTGFDGPSVYSRANFKKIRAVMAKNGKLIDPEREIKTSKRYLPDEEIDFSAPTSLDGMTIPRMDQVVKGKKGKKGKKKRTGSTLVDLVSMIENGIDMGADIDESGQMELGDNSYNRRRKVNVTSAIDLSDL